MKKIDKIEAKLRDNLEVIELSVKDVSHLHSSHMEANESHYNLSISAKDLIGSKINKHKQIYNLLKEFDIHALSITILDNN